MLFVEGLSIEARLRAGALGLASKLMSGEAVDLESARRVLEALRSFLAFAEQLADVNPSVVDRETAVASGVELRAHLELLVQNPTLPAELRSLLEEHVAALPAEVPELRGMSFSSWVAFPHAATWRAVLRRWFGADGVQVLEVGSYEGRSAVWMLTHMITGRGAKLTCVDMFDPSFEHFFDRNVAVTNPGDRLDKRKGKSADVLPTLPRDFFDVVYLDAASSAADQLADCVLAAPRLKKGGVLIIDDYGGPSGWEPGVTEGTDAFLACHRDEYERIHQGFQLMLHKKG